MLRRRRATALDRRASIRTIRSLENYDFNPDKAKELLAAAVADGKYDPTVRSGSSTPPSRPGWNEIAAALDNDLTAIGMAHEMVPTDDAALDGRDRSVRVRRQPPVLRLPGPRPVEGAGHLQQRDAGRAPVRDPRSSTRCSRRRPSPATRPSSSEAYRDAGRIINKAAPYDWLWAVAHTDAYSDKLTPIIHALARESFAQVEKWTLAP